MKNRCLHLAAVVWCAVLPSAALAQASAPASSGAASAPRAAEPGPRPLTPQQSRESATAPGDLRPDRPVVPQVNVPLGRKPATPVKPQSAASRRREAEPAGGIDDAVARCEAQADRQVRADCRAKLSIQNRSR